MEEKWEIGSLVLKLVLKLLKDYAPNVQEFNAGQGSLGFGIMTHLLQSSQMLRLVLHLLGMFIYLVLDYFRKLKIEHRFCCKILKCETFSNI